MHAGLVLSAHAHNIEYCGLVKVANNASGTRLAGSLDLVQRELVSGVSADITKSPILYTQGLTGSISS